MRGIVKSLSRSLEHNFSKELCEQLNLLEGLGVEGDAHCGKTVKHRSRVAADPSQPNLRQVHLIHAELLEEVGEKGFKVFPGDMGENILTEGIDILSLPKGTLLFIGEVAQVEVTGLRNPCGQIDHFQKGLLEAVLGKDSQGNVVKKSGIMGVVSNGGTIRKGDVIRVKLPPEPHTPLDRV